MAKHDLGDIELIRKANPDIPISLFLFFGCSEERKDIEEAKVSFGPFLGRFFDQPEELRLSLEALTEWGVDRVQLTEYLPGSTANFSLKR